MTQRKYFFRRVDDELCFTKDYFIREMEYEDIKELEVYKAKPHRDSDYFFCRAVDEMGERGECGKQCDDYDPRNGKSGICKHMGHLYEVGEKTIIKR